MVLKVGGPLPGDPVITAIAPTAGTTNLAEGQAVTFTGNYEVGLVGDDDEIAGQVLDKLVKVDGSLATIVTRGVLRFRYTGAAPTVGQSVKGSATPGVVKAAASGRAYVVSVDTVNSTVDVLL